jgi:gas vesicle protein
MDEQDPRVTGRRLRGVDGRGLDHPKRATPSRGSTLTPDAPAATPSRAEAIADDTEIRTHEIRAEIEQTREDMSETVNAIQERLRPGEIASHAADTVKRAARDTVRDVADSDSVMYVRANPIPTAMIGIGVAGLAWLVTRGGNVQSWRRSYRSEPFSSSRDWRTAPDEGSDFYQSDADRNGEGWRNRQHPQFRSRAGSGYLPNQMRRTWNESPLLIGAAAAVLGAIVGLTIPETERENELMGETRDSMFDTVQETVRDKVTEVQQAASNAATLVQDAAKSAVGLGAADSSNKA